MTGETRYRDEAERLLRLYPPRWRAERGDEVLGVLLDTRPAHAARPDLRTRWDLLRGALAYRWRSRPPVGAWLFWRLWGTGLPVTHRAWGVDDANGRWLWVREVVSLPLGLMISFYVLAGEVRHWIWLVVMGLIVVGNFVMRGTSRKRRLKELTVQQWPEAPWAVAVPAPRPRLSAGAWLWWPVAALGVGTAAAVAGVTLALFLGNPATVRQELVASVDLVLWLPLLVTVAVLQPYSLGPFVRPRGRLVSRPEQPHRELVAPHRLLLVGGSVLVGGTPLLAVAPLVGTGELTYLSAVGVWFAVAAGATRLAARRAERHSPGPPVALVDVLSVTGWDRIPVDEPTPRWFPSHP